MGGFENEDGGGFEREALRDGARDGAADLFVAVEEQSYGPRHVHFAQSVERCESRDDSGFHVEYARTPEAAVGLPPWHLLQRADRPDGVEVAEQEDWFLLDREGPKRSSSTSPNLTCLWRLMRAPCSFDQRSASAIAAFTACRVFTWGFLLYQFAKVFLNPF